MKDFGDVNDVNGIEINCEKILGMLELSQRFLMSFKIFDKAHHFRILLKVPSGSAFVHGLTSNV